MQLQDSILLVWLRLSITCIREILFTGKKPCYVIIIYHISFISYKVIDIKLCDNLFQGSQTREFTIRL